VNEFEKLITPIIEQYDCSLYDISVENEDNNKYLRVYIKKENGQVDVDTCAKISKIISPMLDVYDIVKDQYYFEVSSPGIERKLTKLDNFKKSIGENIKIKLNNGTKINGKIDDIDGINIKIKTNKSIQTVKFDDIKTAKTLFNW
jgi:ribosome maturation factor RimP